MYNEEMVTLNCANYKINIYQAKFKTYFGENEVPINTDLWCQILLTSDSQKHPTHDSESNLNNCERQSAQQPPLSGVTRHDIKEFTLSLVKKFVENQSVKVNKLIELNLQMCVMDKNEHYRVVQLLYSWEILFFNIEFNIFYTKEYLRAVLGGSDVIKSDEKNLVLKPEMLDFIRLHAIKRDLLSKRECIYDQKLYLMTYRTSLATLFEKKSTDEIKLNESQILKCVYEIGCLVESLEQAEHDIDFELDVLKAFNRDHFKSLRDMHGDETSARESVKDKIVVDLNSQEFFDKIKTYDFKSRYQAFFETYLMKKENQLLARINQDLKAKLEEKIASF